MSGLQETILKDIFGQPVPSVFRRYWNGETDGITWDRGDHMRQMDPERIRTRIFSLMSQLMGPQLYQWS